MSEFKSKVTPSLSPEAQRLVDIYDRTPGSSGPYCNPAGLAAVLIYAAGECEWRTELLKLGTQLRGEKP
jgi:hypothetical protein